MFIMSWDISSDWRFEAGLNTQVKLKYHPRWSVRWILECKHKICQSKFKIQLNVCYVIQRIKNRHAIDHKDINICLNYEKSILASQYALISIHYHENLLQIAITSYTWGALSNPEEPKKKKIMNETKFLK